MVKFGERDGQVAKMPKEKKYVTMRGKGKKFLLQRDAVEGERLFCDLGTSSLPVFNSVAPKYGMQGLKS